MIAKIKISPTLNLDLIAEAAGQPDVSKRLYRDGFLEVQGVTQAALEAAAASPPSPAPEAPSDIEVRLAALELKVGITEQDKTAALAQLISEDSSPLAKGEMDVARK